MLNSYLLKHILIMVALTLSTYVFTLKMSLEDIITTVDYITILLAQVLMLWTF